MKQGNTRTIEQWLRELPEPARSQALKNMWWEDKDSRYSSLHLALAQAFNWSRSPEGYKYWHNIHAPMIGKELLP